MIVLRNHAVPELPSLRLLLVASIVLGNGWAWWDVIGLPTALVLSVLALMIALVQVRRLRYWKRNSAYLNASQMFIRTVLVMPTPVHLHTPDHACFRRADFRNRVTGRRFVCMMFISSPDQHIVATEVDPVVVGVEMFVFRVGHHRVRRSINYVRFWPDGSQESIPSAAPTWLGRWMERRRGLHDLTVEEMAGLVQQIRSAAIRR